MTKNWAYFLLMLALLHSTGIAQSRKVPNLEFRDLTGTKHKLADLRGSIAVINFWATWCAPCRQEFPMLSGLTREYKEKKVRFISISGDEDPTSHKQREKIDQFLNDQKPAMEIWIGADLDSLDRCDLGQVLPATMILDADGQVIARIEGQAREEDIRHPIEWLSSSRNGPAPAALVKRY